MSRNDLPSEKATNHMARVRETLQTMLGFRGDKLDRVLTLRDVVDSGLLEVRPGANIGSGAVPLLPGQNLPQPEVYVPDLTPPPTPDFLTATGAISHVLVTVPAATYSQGHGHLRTRLYGVSPTALNPNPVFSDAVEVGQFDGTVWAMATNPSTTWRLWAKWESKDNVLSASPAGGTNGIAVTTGQDVTKMVQAMTGPGNPFTILTAPVTIDGFTYPEGTYSVRSFILDASITNAKIANLAVDDAKVASLSVSKLVAGSIAVGQHIQSTDYIAGSAGWRITGNGTAEFSGVVVRGTVYATAGLIGGITIASDAVRAGQTAWNTGNGFFLQSNGSFSLGNGSGNRLTWDGTNLNVVGGGTFSGALSAATGTFVGNVSAGQFTTGAYTGYAWPAVNNYGTYLGPSGLLIGNANNGKYFQVTSDGNIFAPGFDVQNGVMSVTQANVINTFNIAGNAVTVPVGAYTAGSVAVSTDWTNIQSAYIEGQGFQIFLLCSASGSATITMEGSTTVSSPRFAIRLLRNGADTGTLTESTGSASIHFMENPGSGGFTYTLQMRMIESGTNPIASARSLLALGTRR